MIIKSVLFFAMLCSPLISAEKREQKTQEKKINRASPLLKEILQNYQSVKSKDKEGASIIPEYTRLVNGKLVVNITTFGDTKNTLRYLKSLGLENGVAYKNQISGYISLEKMNQFTENECVRHIMPALMVSNAGEVTSEGVPAVGVEEARKAYNVDGKGVRVATLSDSYNALNGAENDIKTGDLPKTVTVLPPVITKGTTDEGRAMMQIIHDVAPGASLYFRSTALGDADYAKGINDLVKAGVDIINDDVLYFSEPFFQDGIVAKSAEEATKKGVHYFSAAANLGDKSYEAPFSNSGQEAPKAKSGSSLNGVAHNFNPEGALDIKQRFVVPVKGSLVIIMQWAQPFVSACSGACFGPKTNIDFGLYNADTHVYEALGQENNITTGLAFEFLNYINKTNAPVNLDLIITKISGPDPELIKYIVVKGDMTKSYNKPGTTSFGHSNADGVISVASSAWYNIKPTKYKVNQASSRGGIPIIFDPEGNKLKEPIVRKRPFITAPDGGSTTFFGSISPQGGKYPRFFGTSAATPHAAGIAALVIENAKKSGVTVTPELMAKIFRHAAEKDPNSDENGYNHKSGYGLIRAKKAVCADVDNDGVCINEDQCPEDPEKVVRGKCGCGVKEGTC